MKTETEVVKCMTCERTYTGCKKCGSDKVYPTWIPGPKGTLDEITVCGHCAGLWPNKF